MQALEERVRAVARRLESERSTRNYAQMERDKVEELYSAAKQQAEVLVSCFPGTVPGDGARVCLSHTLSGARWTLPDVAKSPKSRMHCGGQLLRHTYIHTHTLSLSLWNLLDVR